MQLIERIEVHYLRSLYKLDLKSVGDLNVIFGRNDSGKSNLLRALNLFFNGVSEPKKPFDFDLDLSDIRREEARAAKGKQFIWTKITFNTPSNYASLGEQIEVKRQWNRDGEVTENIWPKELSQGSSKSRLTRFLNDIDFTYIPAIKDLSVHADLIERMYAAAAQSNAISVATDRFVDTIGQSTVDLTKQLSSLFKQESKLSAPTELSLLFRNLDFAYGSEGHSMLRQKGDGIKARHIPEILRFINENEKRKKFHIWGFEEPENSLDLGAAGLEANRFGELSSRDDTQIFLTSHSPAFYLSENPNTTVSRYFVSKQTKQDEEIRPINAATDIRDIETAEAVMENAGLLQLPYVIKMLREMPEKLAAIEGEKEKLESQLQDLETPTLFVEGPHDLTILNSRLGRLSELNIKKLNGTPSTVPALLGALGSEGRLNLGSKALIVFDNDPPGRNATKKLMGTPPIDFSVPNAVTAQLNVMCLPYNPSVEFNTFAKEVGLVENDLIFEGEFLLNIYAIIAELDRLGFEGKKIHEEYYKKPQEMGLKMLAYERGTPGWLFSRTVPDNLKQNVIDECLGVADTPALDALVQTIESYFFGNS